VPASPAALSRATSPLRTAFAATLVLAFAGCGVPPEPSRDQPALAAAMAPMGDELARAGITTIHAWSDRAEQPVQVLTRGGPIYFPWPAGVPLARFALVVDGNRIRVASDDYDPASHDRYVATMKRASGEALRLAADQNAVQATREKASR
jgi:hypothetical protein